jgi:hypothetical protein
MLCDKATRDILVDGGWLFNYYSVIINNIIIM